MIVDLHKTIAQNSHIVCLFIIIYVLLINCICIVRVKNPDQHCITMPTCRIALYYTLKAMNMSKGDEVLWAFAQFLRAMLGEQPVLMRMGGERFAAILPSVAADAARSVADETVGTFSSLARETCCDGLDVSASAGVAAMAGDHDEILANAEMALTLAQASGGRRTQFRDGRAISSPGRRRA